MIESLYMIFIKEAREILGKDYENCSDEEIEKVIDGAYMFADIFLEGVIDKEERSSNDLT